MARKKENKFLKILKLRCGRKGKAIGFAADGKVIFINNAVQVIFVPYKITKKRKSYYEGKAISFSNLSDKRVEPKCDIFGTCGGCKWQYMGYEHQLFYKQKEVENNLKRIGKIELPDILPILGAKEQYYYRNKMEFSFSDSKWLTLDQIKSDEIIENRNALGFHIPGMWDKILDIDSCHLQRDPSNNIRNFVKNKAEALKLTFYNNRKQEGFLRTLMIRTATTGDLMVLVQFFHEDKANRELLLEAIANEIS